MEFALSEDSDQPGHLPDIIGVLAVRPELSILPRFGGSGLAGSIPGMTWIIDAPKGVLKSSTNKFSACRLADYNMRRFL